MAIVGLGVARSDGGIRNRGGVRDRDAGVLHGTVITLRSAWARAVGPPPVLSFDYDAQPKEPVLRCNLCGSSSASVLARRDRYGFAAQHVQCSTCGLVWISPRMTAEAYRAFYRDGHYRRLVSWHSKIPIAQGMLHYDQSRYAKRLAECLGDVRGAKILDVGGSVGGVGMRFGGQVTVLDPAPLELALADGTIRIDSTIEDWEPSGLWDLILVCRSVDHFLDIRGALEKLRRSLAPNGRLWIDAVDWEREAECLGAEKALKIDHPFALTERTLREYLDRAGFVLGEPVWIDRRHVGFVCQ